MLQLKVWEPLVIFKVRFLSPVAAVVGAVGFWGVEVVRDNSTWYGIVLSGRCCLLRGFGEEKILEGTVARQ